jgi:hypothetical protein
MTELSARVDDGWAPPLTPAERAAIETDREIGLHLLSRREHCECELCLTRLPTLTNKVRRYLAAAAPHIADEVRERLAAAGRLLPEGAEHRTQLLIRWTWPDGHSSDWGPDSLEQVPDLLAEPPEHEGIPAETYEVMFREHWASEWAPVPVEVLTGG